MSEFFTKDTFTYLEGAKKNRKNLRWFKKNCEVYDEHVKMPFSILIKKIDLSIGDNFPKFAFGPRKISSPLYRANNVPTDGTLVKSSAWAFFSEKNTSMYEWNPGIYLSLGVEENVLGQGLYMPSGRQMKLLRSKIMNDPATAKKMFENKKLLSTWGNLAGDKFVRFPREYDQEAPGAKYLWHKQFYFHQIISRKEIMSRTFADRVISDLKIAAPYLQWMRSTVGVYQKKVQHTSA